jgi:hypothetical protein
VPDSIRDAHDIGVMTASYELPQRDRSSVDIDSLPTSVLRAFLAHALYLHLLAPEYTSLALLRHPPAPDFRAESGLGARAAWQLDVCPKPSECGDNSHGGDSNRIALGAPGSLVGINR